MPISRRDALKALGACAATGSLDLYALAQTKQSPPRLPLDEFVQDDTLLKGLRRGIRAMQKRKQSDPLSWFYQAAIHGVTLVAVQEALSADPGVAHVFQKRYWNQCPHDGENSANFLPWHRAYTYYFEKILRMHTELDTFSLPYWNYIDPRHPEQIKPGSRKFPKAFGIKHLDGDLNNDDPANINPLYYEERDYYLCGYEHSFATGLPYLELGDSAVDISPSMSAEVFFGTGEREGLGGGIADEDPTTRGLLESYPHDPIHRVVGGIIGDKAGAMATPPTAALDPIFPFHHSNIDWLWAYWSCLPGKSWGERPSTYWFNERAWYFYDTDGKVVNEPRKMFFDHRALGIRFKDEDEMCKPLTLPEIETFLVEAVAPRVRTLEKLAEHAIPFEALPHEHANVPVPPAVTVKLQNLAKAVREKAPAARGEQRILLRMSNVRLGLVRGTGFDVHLTDDPKTTLRRSDPSFVGSINLFRHEMRSGGAHGHVVMNGQDETFDVTKAIAAAKTEKLEKLRVVLVSQALLTVPGKSTVIFNNRESLQADGIQFLRMEMR